MAYLACPECFCEVKEVFVKLISPPKGEEKENVVWLKLDKAYCLHCQELVETVIEVREEVRA